jgi:phosphoserine phosphatase RsbU/P
VLRDPVVVATMLNERLLADSGIEEYFTMVYAVADLSTGVVKLVQAGHPHPLVIHSNGQSEFVGEGGIPIELLPGVNYSQFEFSLIPGDRLLLYSDGFTECRLTNGEMLEEDGLLNLIGGCMSWRKGQEFLDDLFWALTQKVSPEHGMEDDVSATLFQFNGI